MLREQIILMKPDQIGRIRQDNARDIVDGAYGSLYSEVPLTENFFEGFDPKVIVALFPKPPYYEPEINYIKYEGGVLTPEESLEYRKIANELTLTETNLQLEKKYYNKSQIECGDLIISQLLRLSLLENLPIAMILFNYPNIYGPRPACLFTLSEIPPSIALRYVRRNTGRMMVG
jgi:hypothetical protein